MLRSEKLIRAGFNRRFDPMPLRSPRNPTLAELSAEWEWPLRVLRAWSTPVIENCEPNSPLGRFRRFDCGPANDRSWARLRPAVMSAIRSLCDGKWTLRKPYSTSSIYEYPR